MSILLDTFPAPSLNVLNWDSTLTGGGALVVGVPANGAYTTIATASDAVDISSKNKRTVPGSLPFEMEIVYNNAVPISEDVALAHYFGWRSIRNDPEGNPSMFGVDIIALIKSGPMVVFQQRVFNVGSQIRSSILQKDDETTGGLKIVRAGHTYSLYYQDNTLGWTLLQDVVLPSNEPGYIVFGSQGEDPEFEFPWTS